MKGKDDKVLVVGIKNDNKDYFKRLYDRYHRELYFLAKKYLKNEELAKDSVQDIFLKLWKKRKTLDESSSIKSFLYTMLKNHVLNMIRDKKNHRKILNDLGQTDQRKFSRSRTEEEVIYSEYRDLVHTALKQLSPAQRKVFKMRSFEGLSNAEVAGKRKVSVNTVKTQFYLSSKFIRNYLKDYMNGHI